MSQDRPWVLVPFMAPKRKAVAQLGSVSPHGNFWRVVSTFESRRIPGPCRARKSDAYADLKQARMAETREEHHQIIRQLQKTAQRQRDEAAIVNQMHGVTQKAVAGTLRDQIQNDSRLRTHPRVEVQARTKSMNKHVDEERGVGVLRIYLDLEETSTGWKVAKVDQSQISR